MSVYFDKLRKFITSLSSDISSREISFSLRMFNESMIFKREFIKDLDHLKYDKARYEKRNIWLSLVFESMKMEDWREVLGLNFNDILDLDHETFQFLRTKLEKYRNEKRKVTEPIEKDVSKAMSELKK